MLRKRVFRATLNRAFREVMLRCASVPRKQNEGTWIVPEMVEAYCRLHRLGYAHSVEVWYEDNLVGGLYGIAMGGVFFGESMFFSRSDASKVALVHLVCILRQWGFELIDCQVTTAHLMSMGAREIPRSEFLTHLAAALRKPVSHELWNVDVLPEPS